MIWHTGRESYRHLLKVLSLLCYPVNVSNVPCFIQSHIITYLTYWYILLNIIHILYLHTLLYTMLYSAYIHIYSYAHILWCYDNTITWSVITPSRHTHHTCIYITFCHALYYNLSYIYNLIQKQDRQQQTYYRRTQKEAVYFNRSCIIHQV